MTTIFKPPPIAPEKIAAAMVGAAVLGLCGLTAYLLYLACAQ